MKHNLSEYKEYFKSISNGNRRWRIAIYVRLSKEDGKKVSLSIVNQIKQIARYISNLDDYVVYDIYIDDGLTGTDFARQDYMRMQNDIDYGLVNCVIVKDLTRYARNIADGIKELDSYVLEKNIRFISVGIPQVDTFKNPTAISSPEVYQALQNAEDFARITSLKVRDVKEMKREAGEKNGGFPPYGFLPNPKGEFWLPDPKAQEIVRQIYQWSMEGLSDREIAKKLNSLGIPNPTLYKQKMGLKYSNPHALNNTGLWWPGTVARILSDKTYIGASIQGKSSSFDHKRHKQISKKKEEYVIVYDILDKTIDNEDFEKVKKIRQQRTRITKTGEKHIFSGLVYCSNCEKIMKKTGSRGHDYLVCRTYRDLGKEYCSKKRTISFNVLEDVILNIIKSQINLVENLHAIVEKINQKPEICNHSTRLNEIVQNTKNEVKKTEYILDATYYDWKNGDISKEQYQRVRMEMEKKLERLRNALQNSVEEQQKLKQGIDSNDKYFERFLKYKNIEKLDRLILTELIERIYVNEDKSLKVEFKYTNQYLLVLDYIEENSNQKQKKLTKE